MKRPIVYRGVTYPEYEMDFYTLNVYSVRFKDRVLKVSSRPFNRCINVRPYLNVSPYLNSKMTPIGVHQLMAETFYDLLPKSPLVSHYGLKIGRDRHELKTPTDFTFICNQVCPDHIDGDPSNNHHSNLMIVTQLENNLKRGPNREGCSPHKGVTMDRGKFFRSRMETKNILDKNGKRFYASKNFKTEEEAALAYNTMLEESLLTIWGPDLGPKLYHLAYKNEVPAPVQSELFV